MLKPPFSPSAKPSENDVAAPEATNLDEQLAEYQKQKQEQEPKAKSSKPPRTRHNEYLGVHVPPARVRSWMDTFGINDGLVKTIAPLKAALNDLHEAEETLKTKTVKKQDKKTGTVTVEATEADLEEANNVVKKLTPLVPHINLKISALSNSKMRFSGKSSVIVCVIADMIVNELAKFSVDRVLADNRTMVRVEHLHHPSVKELSLYTLFGTLPSFVKNSAECEKLFSERKIQAAVKDAVILAKRQFKKDYGITGKKVKATEPEASAAETAPVEVPAEPEPAQPAEASDKNSFRHYVSEIYGVLRTQHKKIRVSAVVVDYLSDLVIEFINRVSIYLRSMVPLMKNKTANVAATKTAIKLMLVDSDDVTENISIVDALFDDPNALAAEKEKRKIAKDAGLKYVKPELPKIPGFEAKVEVKYAKSTYGTVERIIDEKLKLYESIPKSEKKEVAGTQK